MSQRYPSLPTHQAKLFAAASLVAIILAGCYSDNEHYQRQARRDRERRLQAMQEATEQTAKGRAVVGEALRAMLAERTHVFEYGSTPRGDRRLYRQYEYFHADGRYVLMDSDYMRDAEAYPDARWRIDGERLCVLHKWFSQDERCFHMALTATGRVQYSIAEPGSEFDGLLTKVTRAIQEGPPQLEAPPDPP